MSEQSPTVPERGTTRRTQAVFRSIGLLSIACTLLATACSDTAEPAPEIRVGFLLPYTGADAIAGFEMERAALMAADRVDSAGGIAGRELRLVFTDAHSEVDRGIAGAEQLLAQGVTVLVGPESAELSQHIALMLSQAGTLFVSPFVNAESSPGVNPENPWFRLALGPTSLGENLASVMSARGVASAAVFYGEDLYSSQFAIGFVRRFRSLRGTVSLERTLQAEQGSTSTAIAGLERGDLDRVVLAAPPGTAARFVNAVTAVRGDPAEWFLSPVLKTELFLQNTIPGALEGAVGVTPRIFERAGEFRTEFIERWGDEPIDSAYFCYDALSLVSLALESSWAEAQGPPSLEQLRAHMMAATTGALVVRWDSFADDLSLVAAGQSVSYSGLTGPISFDESGTRLGAAQVWEVAKGEIVE